MSKNAFSNKRTERRLHREMSSSGAGSEDDHSEPGISYHERKKRCKKIYIYNYVSETTDASLHGLLSTHQKLGDLEINNNVD